MTTATVERGEPTPSCGFPPIGTGWYAFTPGTTQSFVGYLTTNTGFGFVVEESLGYRKKWEELLNHCTVVPLHGSDQWALWTQELVN